MNQTIPMNLRSITDLEAVFQQLIVEHGKLLRHIEAQQIAMKTLSLKAMDEATHLQEACRLRIAATEQRRRVLTLQIAKANRLAGEPKLQQLADLFPQRRQALLKLREELRQVMGQIAAKNHVAGKLAGAVLGHLNTAVRLLAGTMEQAGLYTKRGVPQVAPRVGLMDAVG